MDRVKAKVQELCCKANPKYWNACDLQEIGLEDITLRPYQVDGVNWLIQRHHKGLGCILGDEMGLGKTCQTVAFLVYLNSCETSQNANNLILCPLSVLDNWRTELKRFAPKLKLQVYAGDKDKRHELQSLICRKPFDILLTTYEMCLKDESFLRSFSWHALVVDEAHRLKNRESMLHQSLLQFDINHRVLLTGTPIQNNLLELYSLLSFISSGVFKWRYLEDFIDKFDDIGDCEDAKELHLLLEPFLLRRIKSEVVKDLPQKTEVVVYHGLSALQKKYYKAILTKDIDAFENNNTYMPYGAGGSRTRLMNILMQLRKCVLHPYLFDGVEPEPFQLGEHLIDSSGKLQLIDQLLTHLKTHGHRVLLFSQMTRMLDVIQDYLGYRGYSYERLDGSVRGEERFLAVQNFNKHEDTFVFLLSTKAGGQGLNLTGADTVVFCDSDFNPQNDLQAAARAHRIGQTRPVKIIRLIGRSTVEETVLRRAEDKLKLTSKVIDGGQFSLGASNNGDDSMKLQDVLKFGLNIIFENEDSSMTKVDFHKMLGPTVNGQWQSAEPQVSQISGQKSGDESEAGDVVNMYVFEGQDFSKQPSTGDEDTFQKLLEAERSEEQDQFGERASRRKKTSLLPMLPLATPKPRQPLTEEEKEQRRKKRAENEAYRKKEAEEEQVKRAQQKRLAKQKLWERNGYTSCNIRSDGESETSDEEVAMDTEEASDESGAVLSYVSGDVTEPQNTGEKDALIIHCVDDSGEWGSGGLFTAISARSDQPETKYEMAGQMKDLVLGDVHLISVDDRQSRENGQDWVALAVTQHRDKMNEISGIRLSALSTALQHIYRVAKKKQASVHLPRIGYNTPGFNWYGTERLIRKYLVSRGVPTSIYYYPQRKTSKRKATSDDSNTKQSRIDGCHTNLATTQSPEPASSSHGNATSSQTNGHLLDFMSSVCVYLHNVPDVRKWTRYVIAYNGEIHTHVRDDTTHVIALESQGLDEICFHHEEIPIVNLKWLEDCVKNRKLLDCAKYILQW